MMTKDEVKREYKEMEGDPEIKGAAASSRANSCPTTPCSPPAAPAQWSPTLRTSL